jgi:hypothetical protein
MMRRNTGNGFAIGGLIVVLIWILSIIGWVMNTWKCISNFLDAETLGQASTVAWVQLIGIFTGPVGSVMGWVIW